MNEPRLTIGIPTLNRPELLKRAIESCLRQTMPVKVVVADQGGSPGTMEVVRSFYDGGPILPFDVLRVASGAETIWDNWREAASWADTEFFAWLQDDDIVAPNYARRICHGFDTFPDANCWIARLAIGTAPDRAIWFVPNGPMVPCDLLSGRPCKVEGRLFPPLAYFTAFGMSPAVAFRRGEAFDTALARVPARCDLFTERMILSAMGLQGPIVCDPVLAGLWIQHGDNESKRQHEGQQEQARVMCEWSDAAMAECPDWRDYFESWVRVMPDPHLKAFHNEMTNPVYANSGYAREIREIFEAAMLASGAIAPTPPDSLKTILMDSIIMAARTAGRLRRLMTRGRMRPDCIPSSHPTRSTGSKDPSF